MSAISFVSIAVFHVNRLCLCWMYILWECVEYSLNLSPISLSLRDFQILSDLPAGRLENMKIESTRIATRSVADGEGYSESNATKSECFAAKI